MLLERQLPYFGHVAKLPNRSTLRNCVLKPSSVDMASHSLKRKQIHPTSQGATEFKKRLEKVRAGSNLHQVLQKVASWKKAMRSFLQVNVADVWYMLA